MQATEFERRLRKLNNRIWIDFKYRLTGEHPDFPCTSLYVDGHRLLGVPWGEIYERTIWGVNIPKLELHDYDRLPPLESWLDQDWVAHHEKHDPDAFDTRIVARGYGFILGELVKKGYIGLREAEKEFKVSLAQYMYEGENTTPRRYLGLEFESVD